MNAAGAGWGEGAGGEHLVLEFHPLANLFPLIEGQAFDELVADVASQGGILEPIVIHEGKILDGRNRYRACAAARIPVTADECVEFNLLDGDPLDFVLSKNLHRRHLDDRQRASIAAKIANLDRGRPPERQGDSENPPIGGISSERASEMLNVAPRQVERARAVHEHGVADLREALDRGEVAVSVAEAIARLPEPEQERELVERGLKPNGARALMASRIEPPDGLDYFPTPPWATRALLDRVFPHLGIRAGRIGSVWEPACGEGHIAEVLREYCPLVMASDVFDYGYGEEVRDFLAADYNTMADWIITNPPFDDKAIAFVEQAWMLSRIGVAMFFRSQWAVEGIERYETIFRRRPPTLCAFFVERVNLCKGRWDPDGTTATAYCWLVWHHGEAPRPPLWIPPGCRTDLTLPDDRERFTAHPVTKRSRAENRSFVKQKSAPETHRFDSSAAASGTKEMVGETPTLPGLAALVAGLAGVKLEILNERLHVRAVAARLADGVAISGLDARYLADIARKYGVVAQERTATFGILGADGGHLLSEAERGRLASAFSTEAAVGTAETPLPTLHATPQPPTTAPQEVEPCR